MELTMLKGKIHRATVVNINNGARFSTYTIAGEAGSGVICLNGAAARHVQVHDKVIIMCYAQLNEKEVESHKPLVVFVDENNKISHIKNYEKHGLLVDQD